MNCFSWPLKTIYQFLIFIFGMASTANAQVQLGEDLVGTDIGDRFGANLEISDDGNRVIIGAFGYAQVFEWVDGANWNQVGSTFFPPIEDNYFGEVVDIANGGTTVMITNKREDQNGFEQCGSVRVFDWSGSGWQQRGSTMYGSDDNEFFGADAVLSADGLTLVAAANWFGWSDEFDMIGQVRRYDWIDGEWVSENGSIDGGNGVQRFGTQLDLSADGLRLVAGGVGAGNGGIVRTYDWTEGGWTSSSEEISIPDQIYSDASGMCLSLSADGQTLVASTTARTNRYEWIDGVGWQLINTWWERAWDLSLSGDGLLLSHGNASGANQWGTLRLMEWENEAWSELSLETGSAPNYHFGYSAGISASGNVHGGGATGEFGFGNETIEGYVRLFGEAPEVLIPGCTDEAACNYDPEATEDDGSCEYPPIGSSDCDFAYDISVETTALAFDEGQGQYVACIGDTITFTAVSDLSSSFELWLWTWTDGTIDTTLTNVLTTDFDEAGFYTFYVEAYGNGTNAFSPPVTVTVSPEPVVDLEVSTPLCVNSVGELSMNAVNFPTELDGLSSTASSNLPDATGVWFENSIVVDDFPADLTLADCADLVGFNLLIEHSFVGDLSMQIECPNGTTVSLLENNLSQPDACNGDDGDLNGQDLGEPGMGMDIGTGYWYSFTGYGEYVLDDLNIASPPGEYAIPSGEYALCGDICDFEGCPLNGTWTLGILDSWGGDNGYLFEWGIEFTDEFIEESLGGAGFPSVDDALTTGWQWDDEMQNVDWLYTSEDSLSMSFSEAGVYPFTYNMVNSFGCSATVEVDVEVVENDLPEISLDESIEFCDFPVNLEASFNGTESSCASTSGSYSYCYGSNDNQFFTYCPDNPGDGTMLSLSFSSGNIDLFWDQITVYDGDSELSPILDNVDGDLTGLSWIATNPDGCISFSLNSDGWGDCESLPELYSILEWCVSCGDATLCGYDWTWSAEGWESPSNDPSVSIDYLPSNPILISVEATPSSNAVCSTSDSIWVIQDSLCTEFQNDVCEGLDVYTYNGHTYPVVAIGEHCWFQENLRTSTFRNGDTIPFAEEETPFWYSQSQPRRGVYQDNDTLGTIAGNLYNYSAVVDSRELCPAGWHVPISTDFLNLVDSLGSSSLQFRAVGLASEGTGYWDVDLEGTDETGMSIQPFGARTYIGEDNGWGTTTSLWCASTGLPQSGEGWNFSFTNLSSNLVLRSRGRYVRCVLGEYAYGCTNPDYANYDNGAEFDDGSCEGLSGCTDETACNYDPEADENDGSCLYFDALGECDGDCQSDANGDGICDVFVLIEEGLAPFNQADWRAAVRDFNNDGLEDVLGFNSNEVQSLGLYLSQGDLTFIDVSESLTAPADTLINFVDAVDVNKDGLLDMLFTSRPAGVSTSNNTYFWYINSGTGYTRHIVGDNLSFEAMLQVANVSNAYVVDYSNDGIPDWIFKVNNTVGAGLMGVRGTLEIPLEPWLINAPEVLIPLEFQNILGNPMIDIDDDFDLDFKFINGSNQYSATQVVHFENDGNGLFTQIDVPGFETARAASFGTSGDLNRDGILDFVTGRSDCCVPQGMALHYGNEDGSFTTYQNALDYEFNPYLRGGEVIDLDLDGKEDILWTRTSTVSTTRIFFHHQVEWGQFEEAGEEFGFGFESAGGCCPIGQILSAVTIDMNNDAKPDVMINEAANIYSTFAPEEGNWQLLNTSPHSGVRVELRACHGMTQGFGARVRGFIDGEWYVHRLGWLPKANSHSIYFGLPNDEPLDVLIVDWVGGGQTVLTDIAPGTSMLIFESDECAPAIEECDLSLACGEGTYWEPLVGQCLPSDNCLGDLNSDGVISTTDLLVFLSLFGTVCD